MIDITHGALGNTSPHSLKGRIVTSNLDLNQWGEAFPNKLLGATTLDRLRHRAYQVVLDGKSYRAPRPVDQGCEGPVGQAPKSTE